MARKEIYEPYLDVIYYVAAELNWKETIAGSQAFTKMYRACQRTGNNGIGFPETDGYCWTTSIHRQIARWRNANNPA
jgi:hypothetical protein